MKLLSLTARGYRSLRDETIEFGDLNLFIGPNASGKSTILDALRFLHEGVQARDFRTPVASRGGTVNFSWNGQRTRQIELAVRLENGSTTYDWSTHVVREGFDFHILETVYELQPGSSPIQLLKAEKGKGWWSGSKDERIFFGQEPTSCALAAASVDTSFRGRDIVDFVRRWGFFDPNPFFLRSDWRGLGLDRFDPYGRNLAGTLYKIAKSSPETLERIRSATHSIVGIPSSIHPEESEGSFYFMQKEDGIKYPIHQMGISSGTLRMMAFMTALIAEPAANLIGIEEPESCVHPTALRSFVDHILEARERTQFLITTHSPILLDFLDDPAAVSVVRRGEDAGTTVIREKNPAGVRQALEASDFGLGEFYETTGFGS